MARDTIPSAVALTYSEDRQSLPRVVAQGRGQIAEKIVELAARHGIPVRQDPDLVRILDKLDLDSEIPTEAFVAVAEILAVIYRANGRLKR